MLRQHHPLFPAMQLTPPAPNNGRENFALIPQFHWFVLRNRIYLENPLAMPSCPHWLQVYFVSNYTGPC